MVIILTYGKIYVDDSDLDALHALVVRIIDLDSGEYGGGDYLRSLISNYVRANGANVSSRMQEAVLNSRTPIHVHEDAKKTVRINGIDITGM